MGKERRTPVLVSRFLPEKVLTKIVTMMPLFKQKNYFALIDLFQQTDKNDINLNMDFQQIFHINNTAKLYSQ